MRTSSTTILYMLLLLAGAADTAFAGAADTAFAGAADTAFAGAADTAPENAQNPSTVFLEGNRAYHAGDYAAAERHYSRILDSGMESGALYYNLGNTCFKQKRLGAAIFYWEKAREFAPLNREIGENLELANSLIPDRVEASQDPLPVTLLTRAADVFSFSRLHLMAVILFAVLNILIFLFLGARKPRAAAGLPWGCVAAGVLFLVFAGALGWRLYEKGHRRAAIVAEQKIDVRSAPDATGVTVFSIHEGLKVRVHERRGGWCQISLPNGWSGWVPESVLRPL